MKAFSELTSASQVNNGDLVAISQTSGSGYVSKKTTVKDITDKSNLNLAEEYDSTSTYAVDDYVIYESVLYKCIGTTTGTFDSTKWTSVVVTDEMGSGGGGGTGGHTIIDENGNSMTARAGLQFVGGVRVTDDNTNNKTIVEVLSGGSGNGYKEEIIFNTPTDVGSGLTVNFSNPYTDYDFIYIDFIPSSSGLTEFNSCILKPTSDIALNTFYNGLALPYQNTNYAILFEFTDNKTLLILNNSGSAPMKVNKVVGINFLGGNLFQPVIYSTEEREVGCWIDGKPLYQKTVYLASVATGTAYAHNIQNVENIFIYSIKAKRNTGGWFTSGHIFTDTQTLTSESFSVIPSLTTLYTYLFGCTITECYVTLQYTKTTDVAGSGSWTPQGVPTHHYSTDEQIVGTWNGETLYEKTYFNVSITNGANNLVESNFDSHRVLQNFSVSAKGMANTLFNYNSSVSDTLFVENGELKYYVSKAGSWWNALNKVDITIQYTKTS